MNRPAAFPDEDAIDFGDLTRSVGFLLRMAQLQSFDMFFARLAKHGLKPGEFTLLWVVGLNPGLRQGSLARRLRIKPAHMTKLVQRLVAARAARSSALSSACPSGTTYCTRFQRSAVSASTERPVSIRSVIRATPISRAVRTDPPPPT